MRLNLPFHTQFQKCQRSEVVAEEVIEEEVVEDEAVEAQVEELQMDHNPNHQNTKVQSTLTFHLGSGGGVECISGGEEEVISAQSHLRVPGGMSTLPSLQNNEKLTNSAKKKNF